MNANIFEKANQVIKTCNTAYIGVIDENGCPSVSTMSPIKPENIFEVYFSTNLDANKTKRLLKDKRASVCFSTDKDNITLVGEAEILTDQETKSRMWLDWFSGIYLQGETDPNYCIIKIATKRVSLWVDGEGAEITIDQLLKIQSRCGLLCGGCTYRESNGCGGCIETNGHPFYGECPVAKCCQDKGFSHCGECAEIPCPKLYEYSYTDPEHGDKPAGARVEVCRAWAARA